jgi:HSP20 family protein
MKFPVKSLLVALCVMSVTTTFANTSLQIQDQPDTFPGASGADSIFEQYRQMQEDMVHQAFNDPFFKRNSRPAPRACRMAFSNDYPQTKYIKTKEAYILTFITPGMSKENISVTLNNQTLTVSGKYNKKTEKKDNSSSCEEQVSRQFSQTINIPDDVITSKITSKYKNGVLTITLPKDTKKTEENTKTIKVE